MSDELCCDGNHTHPLTYFKPTSADELQRLARLYKVLSDANRLKLLYLLNQGELCVCDLVSGSGLSQPLVSASLKILREARLIKRRQAGQRMWYSLDDEHISLLFNGALEHIRHIKE